MRILKKHESQHGAQKYSHGDECLHVPSEWILLLYYWCVIWEHPYKISAIRTNRETYKQNFKTNILLTCQSIIQIQRRPNEHGDPFVINYSAQIKTGCNPDKPYPYNVKNYICYQKRVGTKFPMIDEFENQSNIVHMKEYHA